MSRERFLPPWVLQLVGVLLLLAAFGFWTISDRESALLVGAALTLIGVGSYGKTVERFKRALEQPPPEPEPSSTEQSQGDRSR